MSGQDARLGHRAVALQLLHATDGHFATAKRLQQQAAGLVIADDADGQHIHAKVSKIAYCIRAATRNHGSLTVLQDEHRRFPTYARYLAKNELVRDHVSHDGDTCLGKTIDKLE